MKHRLTYIEVFQKILFRILTIVRSATVLLGYDSIANANGDSSFLYSLGLGDGWSYRRGWRSLCIQTGSGKFHLRYGSSDKKVFKQIFVDKEYSPLVDLIKSKGLGSEIKTIIDAGANIGLAAIYFSNEFSNSNKIICIEADQNNTQILLKNSADFGLSAKVRILNKALWSKSNLKLAISNEFRDGQNWSKAVKLNSSSENFIESISFSDILLDEGVDIVDILKIDIEGAEVELFESHAWLQLLLERVKFMAIEIHEEVFSLSDAIERLHSVNFQCFCKGETLFAYNKSFFSNCV